MSTWKKVDTRFWIISNRILKFCHWNAGIIKVSAFFLYMITSPWALSKGKVTNIIVRPLLYAWTGSAWRNLTWREPPKRHTELGRRVKWRILLAIALCFEGLSMTQLVGMPKRRQRSERCLRYALKLIRVTSLHLKWTCCWVVCHPITISTLFKSLTIRYFTDNSFGNIRTVIGWHLQGGLSHQMTSSECNLSIWISSFSLRTYVIRWL
jgi:hypothetical protein